MPLPTPNSNEGKSDFVSRCMGADKMKEEFSDRKQRVAVCYSQFSKSDKLGAALSHFAKSAAPERYSPQEDEPKELIDCKSDAVMKAKANLENCSKKTDNGSRKLCIGKAARSVCEASNRCSEKLGLTKHMLECHNYVERSVDILMKEISPTKVGQTMSDKIVGFNDPTKFDKKITVGDQEFMVDVATTEIKRKKGLMYVRDLEEGQGMLFEFGSMGKHSIWMKDTFIDLDVLWFDDNLELVEFQTAVPCERAECQDYVPSVDSAFILEVPAGSFNGGLGDKMNTNPDKEATEADRSRLETAMTEIFGQLQDDENQMKPSPDPTHPCLCNVGPCIMTDTSDNFPYDQTLSLDCARKAEELGNKCASCPADKRINCEKVIDLFKRWCKKLEKGPCYRKRIYCTQYPPFDPGYGIICACKVDTCITHKLMNMLANGQACLTDEEYDALLQEIESERRDNYKHCREQLKRCQQGHPIGDTDINVLNP